MTKQLAIKTLLHCFALLSLPCGPITAAEPSKPNILVILADDHGCADPVGKNDPPTLDVCKFLSQVMHQG